MALYTGTAATSVSVWMQSVVFPNQAETASFVVIQSCMCSSVQEGLTQLTKNKLSVKLLTAKSTNSFKLFHTVLTPESF